MATSRKSKNVVLNAICYFAISTLNINGKQVVKSNLTQGLHHRLA